MDLGQITVLPLEGQGHNRIGKRPRTLSVGLGGALGEEPSDSLCRPQSRSQSALNRAGLRVVPTFQDLTAVDCLKWGGS